MEHFILLKFEDEYMTQELFDYTIDTFAQLKNQLSEGIVGFSVHKNGVSRDTNMDLMVHMTLSDKEMLDVYLNHPIHMTYANKLNPYIIKRCSFDFIV